MRVIADEPLGYGWFSHAFDPPSLSIVVVAKATCPLKGRWLKFAEGPGPFVRGDRFEVEGDLNTTLRYPSDLAPWKPNSDFIVIGSAHAPGGEPVKMLTVEASIGSLTKKLAVFGDRTWTVVNDSLGTASEPAPFVKMPIGRDRAYGGPGFDLNPVGRGHGTMNLPNVEDPLRTIATTDDRAAPAGFGPVPLTAPPRTLMNGTYDDSYAKTRWPWLAADTDWRVFNAAPLDQQIDGYLYGGEMIRLVNLLPGKPDFRCHLPLVRVRCPLGYRFKDGRTEVHDPRMVLDSVVIDTDAQTATLVWRGRAPAHSIKLLELDWMLVTSEPLLESPRPVEELKAEYDRRLYEESLPPESMRAKIAEADVQMAEATKQAEKAKADALATKEKSLAEGAAVPRKEEEAAPAAEPASPLAPVIAQLEEKVAALRGRGIADDDPELAGALGALADLRATDAQYATMAQSMTREKVVGMLTRGESLADRNLMGVDLSGLDFSGRSLARSVLSEADCRGAKFVGSDLTEVVSSKGDFRGVDFQGARMDQAVFHECRFDAANFAGVSAAHAVLCKMGFEGVSFRGAKAPHALLFEARLSDCDFCGSDLTAAGLMFVEAHRAKFDGAILKDTDFLGCKAHHISLVNARATGVRFTNGADIRWADCTGIKAMQSSWKNAVATGSDFTGADLMDSVLGEAEFDHCLFRRANLTGCDAADADFSRSIFEDAIIARVLLDRSKVVQAQFRNVNAVSASFWMVETLPQQFENCNLRKTILA